MASIGRFITRHRIVILILYIVLTIVCATTIGRVNINFDFAAYLNDQTMTKRSLNMMEEEFGREGQLRIMFTDQSEEQMQSALNHLEDMAFVTAALYDPETSTKMIDGVSYQLVQVSVEAEDEIAAAQTLIESFPDAVLSGALVDTWQLNRSIGEEIMIALLIAVAIVLVILLLTTRAWIEPLIILTVLATAIVINMGTNWVFDTISFVSFAVCAILQLALAMDYAIMFLHSYNDFSEEGLSDIEAVRMAMAKSFMPVASSAFTTVAGMLALLFMSFTIGFDIGIVLAKGILISMVVVFTLMPVLVILLGKPLRKTRHKALGLSGMPIARFANAGRKIIPLVVIPLMLVSFILQSQNTYIFYDKGNASAEAIDEVFGYTNQLVLLIPSDTTDEAYDTQRALVERVRAIEVDGKSAVTDVLAMVTTGEEALRYYTADEVAEMIGVPPAMARLFFLSIGQGDSVRADQLIDAASDILASGMFESNEMFEQLQAAIEALNTAFIGEHYARMVLTLDLPVSSAQTDTALEALIAATTDLYGDEFGILGNAMSAYDIGHAFRGDLLRVNLITCLSILLIVAISFRSIRIAVLLVAVIQGAIWINMAISRLMGEPIFFVSYLICVAIQMGATIDYAILLTSNYLSCRKTAPRKEALARALTLSMPTILSSGIILISAGYLIGYTSTVYYISSIGLLLSRGALISVIMIFLLLPSLLLLFDKYIVRAAQEDESTKPMPQDE